MTAYEWVIEKCKDSNATQHVRALFAAGKWYHRKGKTKRAVARFSEILNLYPQRSHADDALLYLARIARKQGKKESKDERKTDKMSFRDAFRLPLSLFLFTFREAVFTTFQKLNFPRILKLSNYYRNSFENVSVGGLNEPHM